MTYTKKIRDAIAFAITTHEVHQKQTRKGKDVAYITHPLTVGMILANIQAGEDVIVAGILHDTIEDSVAEKKGTAEMLAERFGSEVARLVVSVTEPNKNLPWEERKKEALQHIPHFDHDALLVKSADVISNTSELIDDYRRDGDTVFLRFSAPKEKLIAYQCNVINAILEAWTRNPLADDLAALVKDLTS
jgi:(p)ppGpp synthase/HD superfamily hydrolase